MSGYQLASADQSRIDAKYFCPKCQGLLREAVQVIACGHGYCKECVDLMLSEGTGKCVVDGSVIRKEEVFLDKFIDREVKSLVLHCINYDQGCNWKGELSKREEHDALCEFGQVPCVHFECGELVTRAELVDHLENRCKFRMEKCDFCQIPVVFASLKDHQDNECTSVLDPCPKCDRKDIPRAQLAVHIDPVTGDCEEVLAHCPMVQIGCPVTKVMKLGERRSHEDQSSPQHLRLLFQTVMQLSSAVGKLMRKQMNTQPAFLALQREFESMKQLGTAIKENNQLKLKVQQQQERIAQLESKKYDESVTGPISTLMELARRISNEEAKTADLEVLIVEGNRFSEDLQRQVETCKRDQEASKETVRPLQQQVESMQHTMALHNLTMADIEGQVRQQEASSHNGILIWKISDFTRRKHDAAIGKVTSFYSPFFYTSTYGYKLCARIYLNGDGSGKGTHISVFFVVMRGQFDALLRWPFRQKVTMMLLDQDNVEHVIDAFRPDPNSSSFQRPRREMNVASGCPQFFPQSELNKHAYIRDDAMFIKIIVDITDL